MISAFLMTMLYGSYRTEEVIGCNSALPGGGG